MQTLPVNRVSDNGEEVNRTRDLLAAVIPLEA